MLRGFRNWLFLRSIRKRFDPAVYSRVHAYAVLYPEFDRHELMARAILLQVIADVEHICPDRCPRCGIIKDIVESL
jgi:hypothetical protein